MVEEKPKAEQKPEEKEAPKINPRDYVSGGSQIGTSVLGEDVVLGDDGSVTESPEPVAEGEKKPEAEKPASEEKKPEEKATEPEKAEEQPAPEPKAAEPTAEEKARERLKREAIRLRIKARQLKREEEERRAGVSKPAVEEPAKEEGADDQPVTRAELRGFQDVQRLNGEVNAEFAEAARSHHLAVEDPEYGENMKSIIMSRPDVMEAVYRKAISPRVAREIYMNLYEQEVRDALAEMPEDTGKTPAPKGESKPEAKVKGGETEDKKTILKEALQPGSAGGEGVPSLDDLDAIDVTTPEGREKFKALDRAFLTGNPVKR